MVAEIFWKAYSQTGRLRIPIFFELERKQTLKAKQPKGPVELHRTERPAQRVVAKLKQPGKTVDQDGVGRQVFSRASMLTCLFYLFTLYFRLIFFCDMRTGNFMDDGTNLVRLSFLDVHPDILVKAVQDQV